MKSVAENYLYYYIHRSRSLESTVRTPLIICNKEIFI